MTKVKVEFFKHTGRWYDQFEYETTLPVYEIIKIKEEAEFKSGFIKGMDFTIEVDKPCEGWNKYLFFANKD